MARKLKEEPDIEDLVGAEHGAACRHRQAVHDAELKSVRAVRENLLVWYDGHRRKLPWRGDPPPYLSTATHTKQTNSSKKSKSSSVMDAFVVRKEAQPTKEEKPAEPDASIGKAEPSRKVAPYETWVSEIMLQQTRVDTVVDYFLKWLEKFPTVEALANASDEDVNASWAGLGYYRRARMLHAGAKYVMENYNGELPSSTEQLLMIPGIGPYTAGAISSIAFGNKEPLVDGNVIRVVARLRAVGADPKNKQLINFSWKIARELVEDCDRPGAFNQALMELGATLCTVQNPLCGTCPVRDSCLAYEECTTSTDKSQLETSADQSCELCDLSRSNEWLGKTNQYEVTRFPLRAKKNESKNESICVAVISHDNDGTPTSDDEKSRSWKYLMTKRPEGGLLAGQWEFVHSKVDDTDKIPTFSQRKIHMKPRFAGIFASNSVVAASNKSLQRRDLGELVHVFSHVKHHMGIENLHFNEPPPLAQAIAKDPANSMRWMTLGDMDQLGITTGVRKILQLVMKSPETAPSKSAKKSTKPTVIKKTAAVESGDLPAEATMREFQVEQNTTKPKRRSIAASSAHVADSVPASKRLKTIRSFFKK